MTARKLNAPPELVERNGQMWHRLTDEPNGVDCYYPTEGEGSIEALVAEVGDDLDAILQSAAFYVDL